MKDLFRLLRAFTNAFSGFAMLLAWLRSGMLLPYWNLILLKLPFNEVSCGFVRCLPLKPSMDLHHAWLLLLRS
jgi:hypothetical protein